MKRTFVLCDLDCASCAINLERKLNMIDGVSNASINFVLQKLTLEIDDAQYERVFEHVQRVVRHALPKCRLT